MEVKCQICDKILNNIRCLSVHITKNHKINVKEYYDMYFKKDEKEGICEVCKKPTIFNGLPKGYNKYHRTCFQKRDEFKKAISVANKGKKLSNETKNKLSKINTDKWKDPNFIGNSEDYKEKHRKITKQRWDDPNSVYHTDEYRESLRLGVLGENNGMYGKKMSLKTRNQMSDSHRPTIEVYKEKYPIFCKVEELRKNINKNEYIKIQVRCKFCKKWFTPKPQSLYSRIYALEKENGNDGLYLYCSDDCKNKCPLYRFNPKTLTNIKHEYSYDINFIKEVLKRQKDELGYNECENCGLNIHLQIHHEKPQKTHPHLALDPDNGIILCGSLGNNCHLKIGHKDECNTGKLSHLRCKKIINKE